MPSPSPVRVAVIGATGYTGVELIRLLLAHPGVQLTAITSEASADQPIATVYPHLADRCPLTLAAVDATALATQADVAFIALPAGMSSNIAPALLAASLKVIDLGGDFRLKDAETYTTWYKKPAPDAQALAAAVYGLPELWADAVRGQSFISNPGCFPTSVILGLAPLLVEGWIDSATIISDAKSGVSGAGRGLNLGVHFAEVNENFKAYKVGQHQHIPEIEQALSRLAGEPVVISFTTHLVPMTRGILSTNYASLKGKRSLDEAIHLFQRFYADRPFVRIMPAGVFPATKQVVGSNYCDIGLWVDERTNRITVVSVIDNLVKGAAGQAVQNLNLICGFPETLGLDFGPIYP